jgi:hypothetical protein
MVLKLSPPSDTISSHDIATGSANAGNGGNGTNNGAITNNSNLTFDPSNKAYGADVSVHTGDHVHQTASWNAGGANGWDPASWHLTANGGTAMSNGDQSSWSGHDTSTVYANTTATQSNHVYADQFQEVYAGIGGNGGNGNMAEGGYVQIDLLDMPQA